MRRFLSRQAEVWIRTDVPNVGSRISVTGVGVQNLVTADIVDRNHHGGDHPKRLYLGTAVEHVHGHVDHLSDDGGRESERQRRQESIIHAPGEPTAPERRAEKPEEGSQPQDTTLDPDK